MYNILVVMLSERLGIKQRILQFVQSPVYIIYIIIPFILFVTLIDDIIVIAFDRDSTRELIILIIKVRVMPACSCS